jgi:hypothetical protein
MIDDDSTDEHAAKSFGIRRTLERRPAALLPCQQKLIVLQGTIM